MHTARTSQAGPATTTRRTFLKASAVAASALAASRLVVPRFVHAAGAAEIRIGMIGCGGRCSGAAADALGLGKDVKLVAMSDVFKKRMEDARAIFRTSFPDQFAATDDTCTYGLDGYKAVIAASDAVLIACALKYHSFYAEEAVKAGKHVFVEKPHAIDSAGCVRMRRACELAKKKGVSVVSGPRKPLRSGLSGTSQTHPRRRDWKSRGHSIHVPPAALCHYSPESPAVRDGVSVLELVPLPLALG